MGILGLTSFVDHRCKALLQQEHIHDCYLIIDGDNVVHHIFKRKSRSTANGTDYASFSSEVETFFQDLKSCDVSPVVMLDGGRDASGAKLLRQLSRLTDKVHRSVQVAAALSKRKHEDIFPPLARMVFCQVARRLAVPVVQCPREADRCAAALARRLGCAVLSDDSDLCALGVPVVRLTPWQRPCTAPRAARTATRFMNCVVFRPERLLGHYGVAADQLPLLATLPGNDLVPPAALDPFFRRLYAAQGTGGAGRRERPGQRIKAMLRWLATQTSPQESLQKVLSTLPDKDQIIVKTHVDLVTASIADESLEFLRFALPELQHVLPERVVAAAGPPPPSLPAPHAVLPVCVRDAAGGAPALLEPAVEVLTESAAALTAAPLLARLASLLADADRPVTLFVREGRQVAERTVQRPAPPAPAEDSSRREALVLAVLDVRPDALAEVPSPLRLLAAALVAWRRATAGRSSGRSVRAALLACAALVPDDVLPVPTESVAAWQKKVASLRRQPAALAAVHLHYELQYVVMMAVAANEAFGGPMDALEVDKTVDGQLAISLGFGPLRPDDVDSGGDEAGDAPQPDAALERLVGRLTDLIEAEAGEAGLCAPAPLPDKSRAEAEGPEPASSERLSSTLAAAAASGKRSAQKRKRPRQPSRVRSKKRSRR